MSSVSCVVAVHAKEGDDGRIRFRAYAVECEQVGPWRDEMVEAEVDAARMDGHACPQQRAGVHQRLIPRDRLRTRTQALHEPASALRYLPR